MTKDTQYTRAELGALGEQLAADHLTALGMAVLQRNWRCRYGELDLIVEDTDNTVVFVEVKTRTGEVFGGLAEAVSPTKVRRLRRLAGVWLGQQSQAWENIRIDVIRVRVGRRKTPEVNHVQGVG